MSYTEEMSDLKHRLSNGVLDNDTDGAVLADYIDVLEQLIGELARKTGFADDYTDGWRGYIDEEYE